MSIVPEISTEQWAAIAAALSAIVAIFGSIQIWLQHRTERRRLTLQVAADLSMVEMRSLGGVASEDIYLLVYANWTRLTESDRLREVVRYLNEIDRCALALEAGLLDRRLLIRCLENYGTVYHFIIGLMISVETTMGAKDSYASSRRLMDTLFKRFPKARQDELRDTAAEAFSDAEARWTALTSKGTKTTPPFPLLPKPPKGENA